MKHITAILPIRSFDYILPRKTLLPFLNSSLVSYKIAQLKKTDSIKQIIICSDDQEVLDFAKVEKLDFYEREQVNPEFDTFSNLIDLILNNITPKYKHILWANACTPLVNDEVYTNAIQTYFKQTTKGYDSLISVLPFKKFVLDDNGPINFHKGTLHKSTSDLNQLYFWIPAITIATQQNMLKWKYLWGNIPYKFLLNQMSALEIKTLEDIKTAESYIKGLAHA